MINLAIFENRRFFGSGGCGEFFYLNHYSVVSVALISVIWVIYSSFLEYLNDYMILKYLVRLLTSV